MSRRNLRLLIAYEGGSFLGWQRQAGSGADSSVQGSLEAALSEALGEAVELKGAGRTDRGVHAEGQVASFHTKSPIAPEELLARLGALLPAGLRVLECREVPPRFHARLDAVGKVYRYSFEFAEEGASESGGFSAGRAAAGRASKDTGRAGRLDSGREVRPALRVEGPLDLVAMRAAAAFFPGRRDFAAFASRREGGSGRGGADCVRRLDSVRLVERAGGLDLLFAGEGFVYNQVRLMAAALLAVGQGRLSPESVALALAEPASARGRLPPALPPEGLTLVEVLYPEARLDDREGAVPGPLPRREGRAPAEGGSAPRRAARPPSRRPTRRPPTSL